MTDPKLYRTAIFLLAAILMYLYQFKEANSLFHEALKSLRQSFGDQNGSYLFSDLQGPNSKCADTYQGTAKISEASSLFQNPFRTI